MEIPFKHLSAAHCENGVTGNLLRFYGYDYSEPLIFGFVGIALFRPSAVCASCGLSGDFVPSAAGRYLCSCYPLAGLQGPSDNFPLSEACGKEIRSFARSGYPDGRGGRHVFFALYAERIPVSL